MTVSELFFRTIEQGEKEIQVRSGGTGVRDERINDGLSDFLHYNGFLCIFPSRGSDGG